MCVENSFKCNNPHCGRKAYYETCGHIESSNAKKMVAVCNHCYYLIQGFEGETFGRTLEQYLESLEMDEAFHKQRTDFIAKIKKHCQFFAMDDGLKTFALLEKRIALQIFNQERQGLNPRQTAILQEALDDWFKEVFPRQLTAREMNGVVMTDRYENSRYEELCVK